MRELFILVAHLLTTLAKLMGPGGVRAVAAESLMLKHQMLILNRSRKRAPKLTPRDRLLLGLGAFLLNPKRIPKIAAGVKTSTLLRCHRALTKLKYDLLFSPRRRSRPGPKGPSKELIAAVLEIKRHNPRFGCPRIAQQIAFTFGVEINKDMVRRILAQCYRPERGERGPSWLSDIGKVKDQLWSLDLFRCESILLKSHWVMVVMDLFTRRIVGFAVEPADIDGVSVCRMFNHATAAQSLPRYLSSDNDPLFCFHRWRANLRILQIEQVETVPFAPCSHPFVERLIGTIRREYLDWILFWNRGDLERKLGCFRDYYNGTRVHASLGGKPPAVAAGGPSPPYARLDYFSWISHCQGLFQSPVAA